MGNCDSTSNEPPNSRYDPSSAPSSPSAGEYVRIPKSVRPGQHFAVVVNGQQMMVKCPEGRKPGETLYVTAPRAQAQKYVVTVPPNVNPGQQFRVTINQQEVMVACPAGAKPGQQVTFYKTNQQEQPSPSPSPTKNQMFEEKQKQEVLEKQRLEKQRLADQEAAERVRKEKQRLEDEEMVRKEKQRLAHELEQLLLKRIADQEAEERVRKEKQRLADQEAEERVRKEKQRLEDEERVRKEKQRLAADQEAEERAKHEKKQQRLADEEAKAKGLSLELYAEYLDIISSINTLKYLDAENNYVKAVQQDIIDVDYIETLKVEIDRLEAFKPKSLSTIILSVDQVINNIKLFIQTNDAPRAKALATHRDIKGLRSFKELISQLKKHLKDLYRKSNFDHDDITIEETDLSLKNIMSSSKSKTVKLTQRLSDGMKSSNKSIIVDAVFKGLHVKVKLRNDVNALLAEYNIMESLNIKAPNYFIRPFDLLNYDNGEIEPCDGCYHNLSGFYGIVMECGKIDLKAYTQMNFKKPNFLMEFKSVGFDVCEIIKTAHSSNIVLLDLKPANIVRVINNDGSSYHKAIDFDDAIDLNKFVTSTSINGTPRYIAPEVAKAMLQLTGNKFKPTQAIDIFSFGLWVFEVFNDQVSLWACLGIDESIDADILISASQLTDDKIERVIKAKLGDTKSTAARSWLLDALKVHPYDRLTIERLNSIHSLFTTNYATIGMENIATKAFIDQSMKMSTDRIITVSNKNTRKIIENNNDNTQILLNKFQEIRKDIQDEFHHLGDNFSNLIIQTATGSKVIEDELQYLKQQLEFQRNVGRVDIDALSSSVFNMGVDISQKLATSLSTILGSSNGSQSSEEVNKKLDILINMVTNVQDEVIHISKSVVDITRLTSKIAKDMTHYPHTFVILPKPPTEKLESDATKISKIANFVTRKVLNPFKTLIWEESVLLFVCPVTMNIVRCGSDGTGYTIQVPTASLKMMVPALKWGLIFLKIALATQGLASFVPVVDAVLPNINENYINSIERSINDHDRNNDNNTFLDSISYEDDRAAFNFVADIVMKAEGYKGMNPQSWEPKMSGLVKVVSDYDGTCMWVSPDCIYDYKQKGLQIIQK